MALERAAWMERRYGAEIEWLPFDLHPEYPPEGIAFSDLEARYPEGFFDRTGKMIESAGFAYKRGPTVPNSMKSLRLGELARERGVLARVHHGLFRAYWSEGRDIGDPEVLREIGDKAGLGAGAVDEAINGERYSDRIQASTDLAREFGMDGIPGWLIDGELVLVGAHPHEVFDEAMARLGHPPLQEAASGG